MQFMLRRQDPLADPVERHPATEIHQLILIQRQHLAGVDGVSRLGQRRVVPLQQGVERVQGGLEFLVIYDPGGDRLPIAGEPV